MRRIVGASVCIALACGGAERPRRHERRRSPPAGPSGPPAPRVELTAAPTLVLEDGLTSTPLFECSEVNFAWGAVFHGFVVDAADRVWTYDRAIGSPPGEVDWRPTPTTTDRFDGDALRAKYRHASSNWQLPSGSTSAHTPLAALASAGTLAKRAMRFDGGEHSCTAYVWSDATYQAVELGANGDLEVTNSAFEARELQTWLFAIERELPSPM